MRDVRFDDLETLQGLTNEDFGDWGLEVEVTQSMIDQFAELTGDRHWIHIDVERAKRESPFGGPVAHGFLTLSLLPRMEATQGINIVGHGSGANFGAKGLRFLSPVPSGSVLHTRSRIASVEPHPKGTLLCWEMAVHIVGQEKPALLYQAQVLYRPAVGKT